MNAGGGMPFQLLAAGAAQHQLLQALRHRYDLPPDRAGADVAAFLGLLRDRARAC